MKSAQAEAAARIAELESWVQLNGADRARLEARVKELEAALSVQRGCLEALIDNPRDKAQWVAMTSMIDKIRAALHQST